MCFLGILLTSSFVSAERGSYYITILAIVLSLIAFSTNFTFSSYL